MNKTVIQRSRSLRHQPTDAETLVWQKLRNRQFHGRKFRRQRPIGRYVADFCCDEERLIIEIDGGQHDVKTDAARTAYLTALGYRIWRYWNNEVLKNIDGVLEDMTRRLSLTLPR
jgi:lysyl-tRNA synthetase class 2